MFINKTCFHKVEFSGGDGIEQNISFKNWSSKSLQPSTKMALQGHAAMLPRACPEVALWEDIYQNFLAS